MARRRSNLIVRLEKTSLVVIALLIFASAGLGQSPITTIVLGPDQIGKVKTAQGISTRITFPDPVYEIICGDLYDPGSGKGLFVVQGSGDDRQRGNSVYLKPVASRGMSNLFVTTGEKGKNTYNFDLEIVPIAQAHRVVNVVPGSGSGQGSTSTPASGDVQVTGNGQSDSGKPAADNDDKRNEIEQQARRQADEILRQARQQADRIVAEGEARIQEMDRQATQRGEQEVERRFLQALMLGLHDVKVANTRTVVNKVIVSLDPRIVIIEDKAYLRYTIHNTGDRPFAFTKLALVKSSGSDVESITVEITQSKTENKLDSGEVMAGVMAFDPKVLSVKDNKVLLLVRGEENSEIARVGVQ